MQKTIDSWIEKTMTQCKPIEPENPVEEELAKLLVELSYSNKDLYPKSTGRILASAFDLLVAARYYGAVSHTGWFYCPAKEPRLFFHYTNCCPRDVIKNRFFHHQSNKPESGKIGTATARLLLLFYKAIFAHHKRKEKILKGTEPVDTVIVDEEKHRVLFAEIKASPLLTPSISSKSERLTTEKEGQVKEKEHAGLDNTALFSKNIEMFIPEKINGNWEERYFDIGARKDAKDNYWAYLGIIKLLKENKHFFSEYFAFWNEALNSYQPKSSQNIFWLTNACGTPAPTPQRWPARTNGGGVESISDSKTSVGMDRTDDLKKGIYQVLKLGSLGKPVIGKWDYKVAIISNIHAARHFEEYLESLKNVVWTIDASGKAKKIADLPKEQAVYNLFDGLVALTSTLSRDEWIAEMFGRV